MLRRDIIEVGARRNIYDKDRTKTGQRQDKDRIKVAKKDKTRIKTVYLAGDFSSIVSILKMHEQERHTNTFLRKL